LCSGAETAILCRGPRDVANFGQLLGLTQEQAMQAVRESPLAVVKRAEARRGRYRGLKVIKDKGVDTSLVIPPHFYLPEASQVEEENSRDPRLGEDKGRDEDEEVEGDFMSFG
ncbi:unnamed protein product, partial [Discosporangium mesarthrocarpum]